MTQWVVHPVGGYDIPTMARTEPSNSPICAAPLREALRAAASALKARGPRFALAGSYALWAHGAPEPSHDVDLVVAETDVAAAAVTLSDAGFAIERIRKETDHNDYAAALLVLAERLGLTA